MGACIVKQPNGRYARFSTVVECVTHYNMTREDYLTNVTGTTRGREDAKDTMDNYLHSFEVVLERTTELNMSKEDFAEMLKAMNDEPTEYCTT